MRPSLSIFAPLLIAAMAAPAHAHETQCESAQEIGKFDPAQDLLIANFDSKPDVDDIQAVAAFGTVLGDPAFACVNYIATAGAYGIQGGEFIPAGHLFDLAFGERWVDAHTDRDAAVARLTSAALATLEAGGEVWITEAGQSDVSAAMVRSLPEALWGQVHVVQHSDWNEKMTTEEDLRFVRRKTRYHRVSDGNFSLNGSPNFTTHDAQYWPALLAHPRIGALWNEAKRVSDERNPVAAYVNPSVEAGGMDFSDTAELAYVLGFGDMGEVSDFVERFAR